jgi:crotonobetainyl-CoA:carnitine CoA-transferase CaiB-like acyl-CoA transferase
MAADPRYGSLSDRLAHRDTLEAEVVAELKKRPREEWVDRLREAGVPGGAVRSPMEAVASPEARGRDMIQPVDYQDGKQDVVWSPFRLSATPVRKPGRVPTLGENTEDVLAGMLGYTADKIAKARGG